MPDPVIVTPGPNDELPALPMWQARSFWVTLVAAALQIATFARFDLLGVFGVEGSEQLVDAIMQIVAAVAMLWIFMERRAPNFRLTGGEKTNVKVLPA